ncbi:MULTISPECIES: hypothetical protein [unclassified Curtobacterium]|uniref:hypothetical protein n=1 Tax=unclassified Curtobacterium TaxID=257496 RepID=UPI0008DE206B|nr:MULTISPECIES: hypothetical protein [unclassified Curtobacterium]OII25736.1 hypothetical protein BIV03_08225 [Curtobacterium sp. MCBA15_016]OII25942.1 hypothetical protein BIV01_10945 [Curtobacterium sp. MCBA15_013]
MKNLHFRPIDAWTFIEPGAPDEVGTAAATRAVSFAETAVSSRDRARLVREFSDLARYRDTFEAPDFAVLTTNRPSVHVIAHTAVHYLVGDGAADFVIDDSWAERRDGSLTADPEITTTRAALGTATRILLRHTSEPSRFLRRRSVKTSVRWVQPFSDESLSRTAVLTSVIAHESNVDLALPHVDRLALSLELRETS